MPVAQTPRNNRVFVAVCSSYWNWAHLHVSVYNEHLAALESDDLIYDCYILING